MFRRVLPLAAAVLLAVLLSATSAGAQDPDPKSEPSGVGNKAERPQGEAFETDRFVVSFREQSPLVAAESEPWAERGELVVEILQEDARSSQAEAIELVKATPGATFESHWISNALVVQGSSGLIDRLRELPGVSDVRPELARPILTPVETQPATDVSAIDAPWGIEKIRAPEAWQDGVVGGGVVVGSLDSGVQFDHPALVDQYRGNLGDGTFDHNYNWFDAARSCADPRVPCDDLGHGTHTMGTMVGGDGPGPFTPDVGVAPGAEWMTVSCGPFFCTDGQLMEAGEWLLAPTDLDGQNPDPSKRPDIVNNSWGGPPGDPFFLDFVRAWRAAGLVPVFAAGNPGPFCGEGGSPGDYLESFSVGATDSDDLVAEFSGRGPSAFGKVNPDVAAPGVFVLSSTPGNNYEYFAGTSMAAPHVVGTLALMMSADPALKGDVDTVTRLLASTAVDVIDQSCGGDEDGDPNNVYGEGRIDAAAAVVLVAEGGIINGTVTDSGTGRPIAGGQVTVTSADWESRTFTKADGSYRLFVPAGTYTVVAEAFGYAAGVVSGVVVETDGTTTQNLQLTALPTRRLTGVVRTAESPDPVEGATVEVIGVPIDPVRTDSRGRYSFTLPIGTYSVKASLAGCAIPVTEEVALSRNRRVVFRLPTKIDDFGHGCREIGFDWIEADIQSGTYGDDLAGRLDLPFPFPFYGDTKDRVYFTTNGYVSFFDEFGFSNFLNTAIPSEAPPNDAIYALWQDLVVDDQSRIDYASTTVDGQSVFVIEWEKVARLGTDDRLDMEVKLWEDGTIDLLYGEGVDQLGGGSQATIGLENADASDAFQFSFRQSFLEPNTAWRFESVPTGVLAGTVTNANDGSPVAGATITATPGDRSARTDENGQYRLVLVPGRYEVTAEAPNYETAGRRVRIREGRESTVDFRLRAPVAAIEPLEINSGVDLGQTTDVALEISNRGSADLVWELKERQDSFTPPTVGPVEPATRAVPTLNGDVVRRDARWARPEFAERLSAQRAGEAATPVAELLFAGPLDPIIDDPIGDAVGPVDMTTISAGTDQLEASFRIDFSPTTPLGELAGYLFLDTDQDPTTGLPPESLNGLPTQDVGVEYFVDLFSASFGEVLVFDAATFELTAVLPATISDQSLSFDVPLDAVGGDDGSMNVAAVMGNFAGPTDWAPDDGRGELVPFRDTNWMTPDPAVGTLAPRRSTDVALTLGGPDVAPGRYVGSLTLVSNDPGRPRIPVTVELDVGLPADFGSVAGTVLDTRTSQPVTAEIVVNAQRDGTPFPVTTRTGSDGSYLVFAPEGTWPVSVTAEGYVPFDGEVTITAGSQTALDITLSAGGPQIVISAEEPLDFELPEGGTDSRLLNIASTGTEDVVFDVYERSVMPPIEFARPTREDGSPYRWDPEQRLEVTDRVRSQVLGVDSASTLDVIIEDPPDDALATAEILSVRAGVEAGVATIAVDFDADTNLQEIFGLMLLDTDQDPDTGVPAVEIGGLETQQVGVEYFIDMYAPEGLAALVDYETATIVAFLEMRFEDQSLVVDLPVGLLPGEDGAIDVATHFSDFTDQSDWAPDEGRGRIDPEDVSWLSIAPDAGTVPPGTDVDLSVTAEASGLDPGLYRAELVVTSNDPLLNSFPVPVSLTVTPPG